VNLGCRALDLLIALLERPGEAMVAECREHTQLVSAAASTRSAGIRA
jgi:hypothetical protein